MVRMKNKLAPVVRTTYYLKPGQTLKNTKVSERALALIVPESEYQRFNDYAQENERVSLLAEREAKRLAALKQATYEMSKTWEDRAHNIQLRRRNELLSRKKIEEDERVQFTKDLAAKNALKCAEVVKQAKELLLYRKPQCRLINRALLVSECLRELDEQIKFQKSIANVHKKLEDEYAKSVVEDVKKFHEEENEKQKEREKKLQFYKKELEKQIEKNRKDIKKLQEATRKDELEELDNMAKDIKDIKEDEIRKELQKRETLKKMFLNGIEEKRQYELKVQQEEEFQEKCLKTYVDMKREMEKIAKEKAKNAREERARRMNMLAKKVAKNVEKKNAAKKKHEKTKEEIDKEVEEKRKMEEQERIEEIKRKKEKVRLEMQQQMKELEEENERKKKEEMDMKLWEIQQRYKREEFNKNWNYEQLEKEKNKKLHYRKILKKQMADQDKERKKIMMEEDDKEMQKVIDKLNEKILTYGEKVLKESEGVRPTYPIAKTLEEFEREIGLKPRFSIEEHTEAPERQKKKRGKRLICSKPVSDENTFYFA